MSTSTSSTFTLRYADAPAASTSSSSSPAMATSYSLVELPPALLAGIQKQASTSTSFLSTLPTDLVIKGQPSDDAVLCTQDATYNLRAVKNSNSLMLCKPTSKDKGKGKASSLEIESTLHQTLELELVVPKLDRIGELLKGSDWSPEIAEEERTAKKVRTSPEVDLQNCLTPHIHSVNGTTSGYRGRIYSISSQLLTDR